MTSVITALPGTELSAEDMARLAACGIDAALAERAMLRRVDSLTGGQIVGRNGSGDYSGIVIPNCLPGEQHPREYRLRRDKPDFEMDGGRLKERAKYLSPPGRRSMLYFVPGTPAVWLADISLPILITEGEKKCLSLFGLGMDSEQPRWLPIGLSGVWNWRGTIGKTGGPDGERRDIKGPIPDLDHVAWRNRQVTVIFDANVNANDSVNAARDQLARELRGRGAAVRYVDITDAGVNGIDDLIGAWGRDRVLELVTTGAYDPERRETRFGVFAVSDDGVSYVKTNGDGGEELIKLSARIDIRAKTSDEHGNNHGRLLFWRDDEGREHCWAMPLELLAGEAAEIRARLLSEGLYLTTNPRMRERFAEYLQAAPVVRRMRCVSRPGWHDNAYIIPGAEDDAIVYQSSNSSANWTVSGAPEDWRDHIGKLCGGNSRLVLAVSCAFAGPLLRLAGAESGGIHLYGVTSCGKTTAMHVAASVCGGPGFVQSWRATANGLEAVSEAHHDGTLFLDELSQLDPREASEVAYLLANGQAKTRMSRAVALRRKATWRLLFISTGEVTLSDHASAAGRKLKGGVDVRLLNIPANAGADLGIFETLHGHASADAFARHLRAASAQHYGAAFRVFVARLLADSAEAESGIRAASEAFLQRYVPVGASGEAKRAALRFALIGAAGELATEYGITGWQAGEALEAAKRCYLEWLRERGTAGATDTHAAIAQVRAFLERHGASRFQRLNPSSDEPQPIRDRAGFVSESDGETLYYVLPEAFKREVCAGYHAGSVCGELGKRGLLRRDEPAYTTKRRLPGLGNVRAYCIRAAILEVAE